MTSIVALIVFAGASFFFALAESALFSLSKWQIEKLEANSPQLGGSVKRLLLEPQNLLAALVLGNTLSNGAIIGTVLWVALHSNWPLLETCAMLLFIILIGAEVAPKTLAVRAPEFWALRVARPMEFFIYFTRGLRRISQSMTNAILLAVVPKSIKPYSGVSDEDYQELLEMAFQQGALAASEKEIILQIISLDRRTAKDVMKPRSMMACIADNLSVDEMIAAARQHKLSRLPLYDETPDNIVGILNTPPLLLDPKIDLSEVIEFPSFVPESINLLQLFKSLQRQRRGLAVVLDEFGGTAGIVMMEDILEEIVGEIRKEITSEGFVIEKLGEGKWRINGTMRLEDFRREYPLLGEVANVDTMGGLLMQELGIVPTEGQSVVVQGLRLTAKTTDERRVRELFVELQKRR